MYYIVSTSWNEDYYYVLVEKDMSNARQIRTQFKFKLSKSFIKDPIYK